MPAYLRTEIALYMYHKLVRKIYFFQDKEPGFISYVIPKLQVLFLKRNEVVFNIYELAEEVYFLMDGRVDLVAPSGIVYRVYIQGAYFGEVEILLGKTRNCTVKVAEVNAQLLIMAKPDFIRMLEEFPKIAKEVVETAHQRELVHMADVKRITFGKQVSKASTMLMKSRTSIKPVTETTITPSMTIRPAGSRTKSELKKQKYRNMWQKLIVKTEEDEEKKRIKGKWEFILKNMFSEKRKTSAHISIVSANISNQQVSNQNLRLIGRWLNRRPKPPPLLPNSRWKLVQSRFSRIKNLISKEQSRVKIAPTLSPPKSFAKAEWLYDNSIEEILISKEANTSPRSEYLKMTVLSLKSHNFFLDRKLETMKKQESRVRKLHKRLHEKDEGAFALIYQRADLAQ